MLGDVRKTPNLDTSRNLPKGCVMTRIFPGRETTSVKIKAEQEDQLPLVQGKWAGEWPLSSAWRRQGVGLWRLCCYLLWELLQQIDF